MLKYINIKNNKIILRWTHQKMLYYILIENSDGIDQSEAQDKQNYYQSNVFHVVFSPTLQRILNMKNMSVMVAIIVEYMKMKTKI